MTTFVVGFFVIIVMFNRHPAIVYGGEGSVTIKDPATGERQIASGQRALICFKNAAWLRLCPSVLTQIIQIDGRRFDLPNHDIVPPGNTGPLPDKCRPVEMPLFGDGVRGPATFSGFVRSTCWPTDVIWPIETQMPEAHFVVK